jgi:hypothetical protein
MIPVFISGMELTALLALPALVLFGYTVGVYAYGEKKARLRAGLAETLERIQREQGLVLDDSDVFNRRSLGLDLKARKLAWVDHNEPHREWCIDLAEVDTCSLITSKDRKAQSISVIFLELQMKGAAPPLRLYFYREGIDPLWEKPSLFRKAKYWKQKINLYRNRPLHTCGRPAG